MVQTWMICWLGKRSVLPDSPSKRKADVKSSRNEAVNSLEKYVSSLRKKPRIPSVKKTQVRAVSSSSARVKHLVCVDSRKVGGMRSVRGALLEPYADKLENHDLLPRTTCALSCFADGKSAHDPAVESRAVKCGGHSASLTSLEVRMATAKKMRESSAWAKGYSSASVVDPKANKSSPAGDACVSDMLKMNFLSNPSSCVELVDHIRQVDDLGTFSSLSLEKQREATFHLIQKGLVFAAETIRNSSAVAPSSAQLNELEKKNAELASQLSAEQAGYEKKTSYLRAMISELKSSLTEKDSKLNSLAADLVSRKDVFFCLEPKNADISLSYDKLLASCLASPEGRCLWAIVLQ
ncbi:unnamed protein product [Prunus armeniaca]